MPSSPFQSNVETQVGTFVHLPGQHRPVWGWVELGALLAFFSSLGPSLNSFLWDCRFLS